MEDVWTLNGGIVCIGIRQDIYRMRSPENPEEAIRRTVDRFLLAFGIGSTGARR